MKNIAKKYPTIFYSIIIAFVSSLAFIPFLGGVNLFDWDEINFAECAREMIVTNDYLNVQIGFKSFWEKPPLFIWMQVLNMKIFGINEFAARFPNAICGIITLVSLFIFGKKIHSVKFGLIWAVAYFSSILSHFYFRSGIIDPWFNFFIFYSLVLYFLIQINTLKRKRIAYSLLSGIFAGLAILTKGPVAILVIGFVVVLFEILLFYKNKFNNKIFKQLNSLDRIRVKEWIFILLALFIVGNSWFIMQIIEGRYEIVKEFIVYQIRLFSIPDAGHGGNWLYHIIVLLFGMFPISIFAIKYLFRSSKQTNLLEAFALLMRILFWFVLILFTIVKTKIIHYSSLCYFPLSFLGAFYVLEIIENREKWNNWKNYLLLAIGFVFSLIVAIVPLLEKYKKEIIPFIDDEFAVLNLNASAKWLGVEWILALLFFVALIFVVYYSKKKVFKKAFITLAISSSLFLISIIYIYPYRIEKYSQGAIIDFYKSIRNENCYVLHSGYHTYAKHFYTNSKPNQYDSKLKLLTKIPDKPVYLVLKEPHYNEYKHLVPAMQIHLKKNGWIVLKYK